MYRIPDDFSSGILIESMRAIIRAVTARPAIGPAPVIR